MRLSLIVTLLLAAFAARAEDSAAPGPLKAYAGKVVYVDFWASWCGPCAQSFPWLNELQARYGSRLTVVGVNVDTDPAAARAFLANHPAHFDIVNDPQGQLADRYQITGMPSSVILDGAGHVLHQHSGFRSGETADYEAAIAKALAAAPAPARAGGR